MIQFHAQKRYDILIFFILISTSVFMAFLAVKNIKISPDSITYGLVSQQILSGNGIRVPIIWFESNAIPVNGTVPMLIHPPLLPIMLALMGSVTAQSYLAAQILNIICHAAVSILTYLLMKNLYDHKGIALLTGLIVSISYPMLWVTHHILSEPLFITFALSAIYFLTLYHRSGSHLNKSHLFLASIFTSAAISTRLAGVAILSAFFWELYLFIKSKKAKSECRSLVLAITIPVTTILIMLIRNYLISGKVRSYVEFGNEHTYFMAVKGTIKMLFEQFQLGQRSTILILSLIGTFIILIIVNSQTRKELSKFCQTGVDLVAAFIIGYIALICYSMAEKQPVFEARFMIPLVPFLIITSILLVVFISERIKSRGFIKISTIGMILFLGAITVGNVYKTFLNRHEFFYKQEKIYSLLQSCTYDWISDHYDKKMIIATNKPFQLSFFGGYSTVVLPHRSFINMPIPEDMETKLPDRMSEIGAQTLALFREVEAENFGSYLAELSNKDITNDKLVLVHECQDGIVYALK